MQIEGEKEGVSTYFFAALWARNKQPLFADHGSFRQTAENLWRFETSQQNGVKAWEYNLNSVSLYVLLEAPGLGAEAGANMVREVIGQYRARIEAEWKSYREAESIETLEQLWDEHYELRMIDPETELESLRDFIVQKMMGGSELSELEQEGPEDEAPEIL